MCFNCQVHDCTHFASWYVVNAMRNVDMLAHSRLVQECTRSVQCYVLKGLQYFTVILFLLILREKLLFRSNHKVLNIIYPYIKYLNEEFVLSSIHVKRSHRKELSFKNSINHGSVEQSIYRILLRDGRKFHSMFCGLFHSTTLSAVD